MEYIERFLDAQSQYIIYVETLLDDHDEQFIVHFDQWLATHYNG